MKKRLSKKQMFFNKIDLTKDDEVYVGLDVHKESYSVAIWLNDAPAIDFVMPADDKKLLKLLDKIRIAVKRISWPHRIYSGTLTAKGFSARRGCCPLKNSQGIGKRFKDRPTRLQNAGKICRQGLVTPHSDTHQATRS